MIENRISLQSIANWFNGCCGITELDVSSWNASNATNMSCMFNSCNVLRVDCSSWNVDNVTGY